MPVLLLNLFLNEAAKTESEVQAALGLVGVSRINSTDIDMNNI